jgi:hypothetical protein
MLSDNRFTGDSHAVHAERLLLMQQNFAVFSSDFAPMNPEPLSWAPTCYSVYQAKRVDVSHQNAQVKAAVTAARLAFKTMYKEYCALRDYARQLFTSDHETLESFKINTPYPRTQQLQIEWVSAILRERDKRVAAQEPISMPLVFFDRLATAFAAAHLAFQTKASARTGANHARLARNEQHRIDIQNLKLIFSFANAIWEESDVRYNDIGFARPEQADAGSKINTPQAPTGIGFNGSTTLEWTAVPGATSYYVSTSDDGEEWEDEITTQTNSSTVRTELQGKVFYRVRARNAGGFGEFSATFERLFGLAAVQDVVYDLGELSWEEVEFATMYEVERAPSGTSAFVRIYTGSDTVARNTPPAGTWTYRVRGVRGNLKGEWVEELVVSQ